jgi:hypothetical protein
MWWDAGRYTTAKGFGIRRLGDLIGIFAWTATAEQMIDDQKSREAFHRQGPLEGHR